MFTFNAVQVFLEQKQRLFVNCLNEMVSLHGEVDLPLFKKIIREITKEFEELAPRTFKTDFLVVKISPKPKDAIVIVPEESKPNFLNFHSKVTIIEQVFEDIRYTKLLFDDSRRLIAFAYSLGGQSVEMFFDENPDTVARLNLNTINELSKLSEILVTMAGMGLSSQDIESRFCQEIIKFLPKLELLQQQIDKLGPIKDNLDKLEKIGLRSYGFPKTISLLLLLLKMAVFPDVIVFFYPSPRMTRGEGQGGIVWGVRTLPQVNKHILADTFWIFELLASLLCSNVDKVLLAIYLRQTHLFSLRSALAAIMSRNASHNLGSHVLARIATDRLDDMAPTNGTSQNLTQRQRANEDEKPRSLKAWSKDVQIFSRYIQQRMDFIAQISTDWPVWTEPVYLLKDLMRWFLSQTHLLNFIADSDGLAAHVFNGTTRQKQPDIRLHLFMLPNGNGIWTSTINNRPAGQNGRRDALQERMEMIARDCCANFSNREKLGCGRPVEIGALNRESVAEAEQVQTCLDCHRILLYTPETGEPQCCLQQDIQLAIPGGIVGYHAFYVILENVIRNAAKHGYTQAKKDVDHLDVVLEILYDPQEKIGIRGKDGRKIPSWLFRVYDNVSYLADAGSRGTDLWQKNGMNTYLGRSIITESGELRKENWGLAEMKIAAGYLQRREISEIGAEAGNITGPQAEGKLGQLDTAMLEVAENDDGSPYIMRAVASPIGTLGYEFYVPKPRTVGIVCHDGGEA